MDVDAAYLNASLKEDIYMHQPRGFEAPGEEDKVFHLKREIYCCYSRNERIYAVPIMTGDE